MRITVNGVRLYFDVEGAALRPQGATMVEQPTLLLLHGGPGADHSIYKPHFSALTDVAQVVYLDHRGNGRSDPASEASWNLDQWADDVRAFCDALGIDKPIVYGASFGGMVAMAYALRHPGHARQLVLVSTAAQGDARLHERVALFGRLGGERARRLAERRFLEGDTSLEVLDQWLDVALPLYNRRPIDPDAWRRVVGNAAATAWFNRPGGEGRHFNLLGDLHRITCPTLLVGGTLDPMLPIECQRDIAAALPEHLLSFHVLEGCGHDAMHDAPERMTALLRDFIRSGGPASA